MMTLDRRDHAQPDTVGHDDDRSGPESAAARLALGAAILLTGLFAGFFFTYSASVQLGLAQVDDETYVRTFQAINATIRNAAFGLMFFGCVPSIMAALLLSRRPDRRRRALLVTGLVACAAVVVITFAFNVPLNDELATFVDVDAGEAAIARGEFETIWNRWNLARTLLAILGAAAVAAASVSPRTGSNEV